MTQQELADKLYVTIQAVSQWENGKTQPDSDRILSLAKLLGTMADAQLSRRTDPQAGGTAFLPSGESCGIPSDERP